MYLLRATCAVSPIDELHRVFAVQEFNLKAGKLQVSSLWFHQCLWLHILNYVHPCYIYFIGLVIAIRLRIMYLYGSDFDLLLVHIIIMSSSSTL